MNFFKDIDIKVGQAFTIYRKTSREVLPIESGLYELVYINSVYNYADRYVFILKTTFSEDWQRNSKYCPKPFAVKEFDEKEIEHLVSLYKEGYIKIIKKDKNDNK